MAEEREPPAAEGGALAATVALGPGTLDPRAAAFLEKQGRLVELQIEELRREDRLRHWSLRVHHISDVMKLGFELAVAFIVLAIAVFIGAAVWNAAHDNGLVIEPFRVPPDLAARGLTGEVVASQVLDKLAAMQRATASARPPQSYSNNWGSDIKVQIPDTGISVGEFNAYLRQWLGHETHISGEVFETGDGLSVTARVSDGGGVAFSGRRADLDALVSKAAAEVYRQTQPYRYAAFLVDNLQSTDPGRWEEARKVLTGLSNDKSPHERGWAFAGLANIARYHDHDLKTSAALFRQAVAESPGNGLAAGDYCDTQIELDHEEAAIPICDRMMKWVGGTGVDFSDPAVGRAYLQLNAGQVQAWFGDYQAAAGLFNQSADNFGRRNELSEDSQETAVLMLAARHDGAGTRAAFDALPPAAQISQQSRADRSYTAMRIAAYLEDWSTVAAREPAAERVQRDAYPGNDNVALVGVGYNPWLALAKAHLGDFAGADALIAATPADCDTCLRLRGDIAALETRWDAAAYWFAVAARHAPSFPGAYNDWGKMLLSKGDLAGAMAKFAIAHQKGPHFADPLEMWGEALIAQNRSDLAIAKFAEAARYAPAWGRLHLKWGEALLWSGHKDEARKQFAIAQGLDLVPAERSELGRVSPHG